MPQNWISQRRKDLWIRHIAGTNKTLYFQELLWRKHHEFRSFEIPQIHWMMWTLGYFLWTVADATWSCWALTSILAVSSSLRVMTVFKWKCQIASHCKTSKQTKQKKNCSTVTHLWKLNLWHALNFPPKIPYYTPSLCYQYQPSASPGHCYSEEEQRGLSPPLEVSEGEDELEDHKHSSFRKDTSE